MKSWRNYLGPELVGCGTRCQRMALAVGMALWLAGQGALPPAAGEEAKSDRARQQSEAYVTLIRADRARDNGDWSAARAYYAEALQSYRALTAQYPGWHEDIFGYRITYCANQLEALEDASARAPAPAEPAGERTGGVSGLGAADRLKALTDENGYLRQRIADLEEELQLSDAESAPAAEMERLQAEVARLGEALRRAESGPAAGASETETMQRLREENRVLAGAQREAQQQLRALEKREAALQAKLDHAARVKGDREELAAEKKALEQALAEARDERASQAAQLERQVATEAGRANTLEREVARLTAELGQAQSRHAKKEYETLEHELSQLQKVYDLSQARVDVLSDAKDKLELSLQESRADAARQQKEANAGAARARALAQDVASLGKLERELRQALKEAAAENDRLLKETEENAALRSRVGALEGDLAGVTRRLEEESRRADTAEGARDAVRGDLERLRRDSARDAAAAGEERLALEGRLATQAARLEELLAEARDLRRALAESETRAAALRHDSERAQRAQEELSALRQERVALLKESGALLKEIEAYSHLREEKRELEQKLKLLEARP